MALPIFAGGPDELCKKETLMNSSISHLDTRTLFSFAMMLRLFFLSLSSVYIRKKS